MPNPNEKYVAWGFLVFGVIMLANGVLILIQEARFKARARATESWPTVQGAVLQSVVEESTVPVRNRGMQPWYEPRVRYRYQVDGQQYESDRISIPPPSGSGNRRNAQSVVGRYAIGVPIEVRYNPDDPAEAVLETSPPSDPFPRILGIGSLCFGVGMFVLGFFMRRSFKNRQLRIQQREAERQAARSETIEED